MLHPGPLELNLIWTPDASKWLTWLPVYQCLKNLVRSRPAPVALLPVCPAAINHLPGPIRTPDAGKCTTGYIEYPFLALDDRGGCANGRRPCSVSRKPPKSQQNFNCAHRIWPTHRALASNFFHVSSPAGHILETFPSDLASSTWQRAVHLIEDKYFSADVSGFIYSFNV